MIHKNTPPIKSEEQSGFTFGKLTLIVVLIFVTALVTTSYLPDWIPGLSASLGGEAPAAFWYLSRAGAIVAYFLLWLSMMLGTGITNKLGALWPGLPSTIELHKFSSLLGLAFGVFHGLILLGDKFIGFKLVQILVPFISPFQPLAVGLGQTALYVWIILDISFYIRKVIGKKVWRAIHFSSFLMYVSVLVHAIIAGTDASSPWLMYIYLVSGSLLVFMIAYRILHGRLIAKKKTLQANTAETTLNIN